MEDVHIFFPRYFVSAVNTAEITDLCFHTGHETQHLFNIVCCQAQSVTLEREGAVGAQYFWKHCSYKPIYMFLIVTSANSVFLLYLEEFPPSAIHPNASVLLFSFEEQQNI